MWPRHVITQPGYDSADHLNGGGLPEVGRKSWNENENMAYAGREVIDAAGGQTWSSLSVDSERHDQPTVTSPVEDVFPLPLPPPGPAPLLAPVPSTNLHLAAAAGGRAKSFPAKVLGVRRT